MSDRSLSALLAAHAADAATLLPVSPAVTRRGMDLLIGGTPSTMVLAQVISHDPALVCSLLRAANSAFYQGLPKTAGIVEAMTRIGPEQAASVVRQACLGSPPAAAGRLYPRYLPQLWQHACGCALGARWLAERCGYQALADQAYLCGLVHDIGKLFLLAVLDRIEAGGAAGGPLAAPLIAEIFASMHVVEGLRLIETWNLPDYFAEAVGRHHQAEPDHQEMLTALVRMANQGCHKVGVGCAPHPELVLPTTAEAQYLGIDEIALAEFEIMLEDHPLLAQEKKYNDVLFQSEPLDNPTRGGHH